MAKKKTKKKKPKKSKRSKAVKKARKPVVPRKTIVNVPDKPIDPAKIERDRKKKAEERRMMKAMGITKPKAAKIKTTQTSKPSKVTKTLRIHPVIREEIVIKFKKDLGAKTPDYAYSDDAGLDIYSNEEKVLRPMHRAPIKTGLYFELPKGYAGLVWDKGGPPLKNGLHAMAGVLDSGYRGELKIVLINLSSQIIRIEKGIKIAQLLIQKIERARLEESGSLEGSERGDGGFGSSGLKENKKEDDNNQDDDEEYNEERINPILDMEIKKKPKQTVKISKEKPRLKEDIKKAIKEDRENHLF